MRSLARCYDDLRAYCETVPLDAAREVSRAWLVDNPNEFFRLGLDGREGR